MSQLQLLINEVKSARNSYLKQLSFFSEEQAQWTPSNDTWNAIEITEHLFWAEQGAIVGMWKTIHAIRAGKLELKYESVHKEMPVEKIIELTWKEKEQVPAIAAPRFGGPLSFWSISLQGLQKILETFAADLKEDELRIIAHPHPISGEMDFHQRLEFLRFHLNRHEKQLINLIQRLK